MQNTAESMSNGRALFEDRHVRFSVCGRRVVSRPDRPIGTRLDRGMSPLVPGTTVLESPYFDLAEPRECRTLPQWVCVSHFKKAFSEHIRPAWRNRVDVCFFH